MQEGGRALSGCGVRVGSRMGENTSPRADLHAELERCKPKAVSISPASSPPSTPLNGSPRLLCTGGMDNTDSQVTWLGHACNLVLMLWSAFAVFLVLILNTVADPPTERVFRKACRTFLDARKRSKFLALLLVCATLLMLLKTCDRLVSFCVFIVFPGYLLKHTLLYALRSTGTGRSLPKGDIRRVLLVCDCSETQVCGVLRKFYAMEKHLQEQGYEVLTVQTDRFDTRFFMPFFPEVQCAVYTPYLQWAIGREIERFNPDAINIMTEGTLGVAARMHCRVMNRRFSTMFCTRYDVGVEISCRLCGTKLGSPTFGRLWAATFGYLTRMYVRWFHCQSLATITPSPTMGGILEAQELAPNVQPIFNGCDTSAFSPDGEQCPEMADLPRPIWLSVGRLCPSKNSPALLEIAHQLPGTVVFVGKGPLYDSAKAEYEGDKVKFLGWKTGEALSAAYRTADVFVFPSKLDTFGQVMVEAMASGLCVAGLRVPGPIDVVLDGKTGCLDDNLLVACRGALAGKDRAACIAHARTFTWAEMTTQIIALHQKIKVLHESKIWSRFSLENASAQRLRQLIKTGRLQSISSHRMQAWLDAGISCATMLVMAALFSCSNLTLPIPMLSA
eukprot:SAG31_NODE_1001_length_10455_cov_12.021727_5_plen_617_part_00